MARTITLDLLDNKFFIKGFSNRFFKVVVPDGVTIRQGDVLKVKGMGKLEITKVLDGGAGVWLDAIFI